MNIIKLPQLIDPHVHFRTPGLEYKEDWTTGSQATIAGGITTVIDMPNTVPPTTTEELLEQKKQIINQDTLINYGLNFAAAVDNLEEIPKVINKVTGVKVFLNHSTGKLLIENDKILEKIWSLFPLIVVHAEHEMVAKAVWLTEKTGNKIYFCHVPDKKSIDYLKKYKGKIDLFIEVTPHHLFLTEENVKDGLRKMLPPLKTKQDQEALWAAIEDGTVDTIGTDHAPHTIEEKQNDNPPYGVPGIETSLPLMLNAVNQKKLTLERLKELMSHNPARIFNIPLSENTYTEVDLDLKKEIKNENLKTKCGWSPFAGWQLKGWPIKVVIDGNIIMENNSINNNYKGRYIYD